MLTEIKEFLAANPVVLYAIIAVAALIIVLAIVGIAKSGKKNKKEKRQDDAVTENAPDAGVTDIQAEPEAVAEPEASPQSEVAAEVTAEETPEDEETVSDAEPVEEVKQEDKPLQLGEEVKNTESGQDGETEAEESISEKPAEEAVKAEEPAAKPAQKTKPAAKKTAAKAEPEKDEDTRQVAGKYRIEKSVDIYQFILYANNGQLLYESREYATLASCKSGIETFKKNIADPKTKIRIDEDKNGRFKYIIKNGNSIYVGETYSTKSAAESSSESVKRFALVSQISD